MLKAIYFPRSDFLEAPKGARPSWVWSSICQGREVLCKRLRWQVKNGEQVDFWRDKWIPSLPNFQVQSARRGGEGDTKVKKFINPVTKEWKVRELTRSVSKEEVEAIIAIPLSKSNAPDSLIWHHSKKGMYSVKSGYYVARSCCEQEETLKPSSSFQVCPSLWKKVWNLKVPPKVKHFWWRACKNAVATKENLYRRKWSRDPICPLCNKDVETIQHLLFRCPKIGSVWELCNLTEVYMRDTNSLLRWTNEVVGDTEKTAGLTHFLSRVAMLGWSIWKARNEKIFQGTPIMDRSIGIRMEQAWEEFMAESCNA